MPEKVSDQDAEERMDEDHVVGEAPSDQTEANEEGINQTPQDEGHYAEEEGESGAKQVREAHES